MALVEFLPESPEAKTEQVEAIAQPSEPTPVEQTTPEPKPAQAIPASEPTNPITDAEAMYPVGEPPAINPPSIDDPDRLVALMVEADQPATAQPGEWMVRGDRAIAVTGHGELDGIQRIQRSNDVISGRIVFATLTMQNHSAETGDFAFSTFELSDSQGRTSSEITDTTYSLWRSDSDIQSRTKAYYPGEVRKDLVAFVVAPDASGFTLEWKEGSIPLP